MNVKHYTYRVLWSEEDQEYVGLCAEFPALSWLDEEQATALEGIVRLVRDVVADLEASNEPIPEPLSQKKFSGKISLRTTPAVHRDLALSAAENGVSLNRLINALITGRGCNRTELNC
ncbi:MAG: toxin-antitoxin system HicB family antitoxin [Pseudodesulfovibrio sp.]